ncbi:hypothetical protein EVJ58_g10155 [Rhodofomes roseus]|uniref:Uncharacterized protein n=1 Tax=Rhodofomes roseus TaxID=34475 RepID=A0A4Y9XQ02_9APHY|nr:hypothetical protein EVJ58_g10155 [Rhodofomes roseus]
MVKDDMYTEFIIAQVLATTVVQDWGRFEHYARHVQIIDNNDHIRPDCGPGPRIMECVEPVLQQFLALSSEGKLLLPRLQRLAWGVTAHGILDTPPLFLIRSPSLQQLALRYNPPSTGRSRSLENVLTVISSLLPGLHTLSLYEEPVWPAVPNIYEEAYTRALLTISNCTHLRQLKITAPQLTLDFRFFDIISKLPLLSKLRLQFSRIDGVIPANTRWIFAALETLELTSLERL